MSAATQSSLMPASSKRLVQPVDLARALLDLRLAIAREVAQLADRLGRHEVGLQQAGFGELTQPRRVGDVGLAARDLLDVPGVDQHAVKLVLQDRPRRLPIHAGGLHHHLRDAVAGEPVAQLQQAANGGRKLRDVLLAPAAPRRARARTRSPAPCGRPAPPGARRSSPLLPPSGRPLHDRRPGASETNESDSRARSTLRSSGETPHARLKTGSQAPRQKDRRYGRRPNHPPLFKTPEGARQRSENSKRKQGLPLLTLEREKIHVELSTCEARAPATPPRSGCARDSHARTPICPTAPVSPTQPMHPTQPLQFTQPMHPTQAAQPTFAKPPRIPADPTTPMLSATAALPTTADEPPTPALPITPEAPATPAEPTTPAAPTTPAEPTIPAAPVTPVEPATPDASATAAERQTRESNIEASFPGIAAPYTARAWTASVWLSLSPARSTVTARSQSCVVRESRQSSTRLPGRSLRSLVLR